ncbi:hypothetical protein ZEAMMB73_Zm00001d028257 [Zea mays]|uniref:Uncharacterized protein n=1 Tax=Zea mays TaxID=4577 RepID=A0A1D6JTN0_MAIZE|nr:hypothetical protein ZEAMMB73_Zm00001d028257 [Zea mays]ONL95211.1 hypothetical protein ZEAMMB73_Zm00001d028257 [Zea mays]
MSSRRPSHPSHRNPRRFPSACYLLVLTLALLVVSAAAKSSRRPISDNEIRQKKEACYTDVENGLWGWVCRYSPTEKENCVLRCLSPECYDLIYGGDPVSGGIRILRKGSWTMFEARSTSIVCTSKNDQNISNMFVWGFKC